MKSSRSTRVVFHSLATKFRESAESYKDTARQLVTEKTQPVLFFEPWLQMPKRKRNRLSVR
jgi:hypothetical protein